MLSSNLRNQLFLGSALLSSAILLVAAWVINFQVVQQARTQVQTEVGTLLPLYDALLNEHSRQLRALGTTLAGSPIIKLVLGDNRARRDLNTLREMVTDSAQEAAAGVELFVISDGAGQVLLAEAQGSPLTTLGQLEPARSVSAAQTQMESFAVIEGKLFQLVLTPVLLDSGNAAFRNTLAVIGTGAAMDKRFASELKQRTRSEVIFFANEQLYASSLTGTAETSLAQAVADSGFAAATPEQPAEISVDGESYLAFARPMTDSEGHLVGRIVVLRSFTTARQFFSAISNRLLLLGLLSLAAAWGFSYLLAGRITRPLETLAARVREFGAGHFEAAVPSSAQGEIGQLARAFEQLRQSLKQTQAALLKSERLATIGQMSSSIIHDLRNPLATISTAAEVLANDGLAADRRHNLVENQLRAAQRMGDMLRELLEFSQGNYKLNCQPLLLTALLQRITQDLQPRLTRGGIQLTTDIPADLQVEADAERLRRVFENLLINALQVLPKGGQLSIRARRLSSPAKPARVRIDIVDDGPGVPAVIRERLFEPFISHGKAGGTGLGLAIARGIVTAHQGQIGLEPATERGAHFYLELPASAPSAIPQET
jgi:signal transduction histidine kinase